MPLASRKERQNYIMSIPVFFLFLLPLNFISPSVESPVPLPSRHPGHADECEALLQFSDSLTINTKIESRSVCIKDNFNYSSRPRTVSWKNGTDCCKWDGISCDNATGRVIAVDLVCSYLEGALHSNSTLFLLRDIEVLYLAGNNLSGNIPTSICQKSSLEDLDLSDNNLFGTIPPCLGNLSNLRYLYLSFNQIRGPLPKSLANCTQLEDLDLTENEITDAFPYWLKTLPLSGLQLGANNFHGFIEPNPISFPFPYLDLLILGPNSLSSRLPSDYFQHSNITFIDLTANSFDGSMPIPPLTAEIYSIGYNRFAGHISPSICNATNLLVVDLSNNSFTGSIPRCLLNMGAGLKDLNLAMNRFRGTIPGISSRKSCSLKRIGLSQNHFTGTLPRSLARCKSLECLDISDNEMEDYFPNWLEAFPNLYVLSLRSNKFHGPITRTQAIHPFSKLHIFDISSNSFSGGIPTWYIVNFRDMGAKDKGQGNLEYVAQYLINWYSTSVIMKGAEWKLDRIQKSFALIDISSNSFQGEILVDIGNLISLRGLNFSHNKLTGAIPSSLANLTVLEWLDLSSNDLTGQIPRSLANLPFLSTLNLSSNQLTGPIPQGRQFNTFRNDSYAGNPGLCGLPLSRACGVNPKPSPTPIFEEDVERGSWIEWKAVPIGYGCGIVIGIFAGYMALRIGRPLWLMRMIENKTYSLQTRARRRARGRRTRAQ